MNNIIANNQPLTPTYQEQLINQLCGAWQNEPSLSKMFAEIDEQRHQSLPRDISFYLSYHHSDYHLEADSSHIPLFPKKPLYK